jgi:hypothetical protein
MRTGIPVVLSRGDREQLLAVAAGRNSPQKHVRRARIVLLTAEGRGTSEIMRQARGEDRRMALARPTYARGCQWPAAGLSDRMFV